MRKLLNQILAPLGYRIERLSRFKYELDRLLGGALPFKFVQIGANDGVRFDGLYTIVTSRKCSGIVVEPLPDMYRRLCVNYADYPQIVPVNVAIHEHESSLALYRLRAASADRYADWATGSASFDRNHLIRHGIAPEDITAEQVRCVPLMGLLQQTGMMDADLLQIDTEGYDAAVVGMIDFSLFHPQIIKYEHMNMNDSERAAVTELLRKNGYALSADATDTVAWRNGPAPTACH